MSPLLAHRDICDGVLVGARLEVHLQRVLVQQLLLRLGLREARDDEVVGHAGAVLLHGGGGGEGGGGVPAPSQVASVWAGEPKSPIRGGRGRRECSTEEGRASSDSSGLACGSAHSFTSGTTCWRKRRKEDLLSRPPCPPPARTQSTWATSSPRSWQRCFAQFAALVLGFS